MADPIADERVLRIGALLATSDDALHRWTDARTWTGSLVGGSAQSGPGPARLRPCHHCEAVGRVVGNAKCKRCWNGEQTPHTCSPCPICEGKLRLWYDPMLNDRRPVDAPPPKRREPEGGAKARRRRGGSRADLADVVHLWERARRRADWGTSRRALRDAMELLRDADPYTHGLLHRAYVEQRYGDPADPRIDEAGKLTLRRGLQQLSDLMPDVIDLPPELEQRLNRDTRARLAQRLVFADGLTRRAAARELGIREGQLRAMLRAR